MFHLAATGLRGSILEEKCALKNTKKEGHTNCKKKKKSHSSKVDSIFCMLLHLCKFFKICFVCINEFYWAKTRQICCNFYSFVILNILS